MPRPWTPEQLRKVSDDFYSFLAIGVAWGDCDVPMATEVHAEALRTLEELKRELPEKLKAELNAQIDAGQVYISVTPDDVFVYTVGEDPARGWFMFAGLDGSVVVRHAVCRPVRYREGSEVSDSAAQPDQGQRP